jgi:hypothetical protein
MKGKLQIFLVVFMLINMNTVVKAVDLGDNNFTFSSEKMKKFVPRKL